MAKGIIAISLVWIVILVSFFAIPNVLASTGLQVNPARIAVDISPGDNGSITLHVRNSQNAQSSFAIYVKDSEYENWFSFEAEDFTLAASESRSIDIGISTPSTASGEHKVYVRVRSLNPSSGVAVGAGIKVPVYISVTEDKMTVTESETEDSPVTWPLIGGIIAILAIIVIVLAVYILMLRKRKLA